MISKQNESKMKKIKDEVDILDKTKIDENNKKEEENVDRELREDTKLIEKVNSEKKDNVINKSITDNVQTKATSPVIQLENGSGLENLEVTSVVIEQVVERSGVVDNVNGQVSYMLKHNVDTVFEQQRSVTRYDIDSLKVIPIFKAINEVSPYIGYRRTEPYAAFDNFEIRVNELEKVIVSESIDMFKFNVPLVFFGLSEFFKGNRYTDAIVTSSRGLQVVGFREQNGNILDVFNGWLQMLAAILSDNEVCFNLEAMVLNQPTAMDSRMLMNNLPRRVGINPAIACFYNNVQWFKDDIKNKLDSGNFVYMLGRTDVTQNYNVAVIASHSYALNVDQYKAAILNINFNALMDGSPAGLNKYKKGLEAYVTEYDRIQMPSIDGLLLTYHYDTAYQLSTLMVCCCLVPGAQARIVENNLQYLENSNCLQYQVTNQLLINPMSQANGTILYNAISSRIRSANFTDILATFALEMSPKFVIIQLEDIAIGADIERAIVVLCEMLIFQLLTPSVFYYVRGHVMNIILRCFNVLKPAEVSYFSDKYGMRASLKPDGSYEYDVQSKGEWKTLTESLSDYVPSLFTRPNFEVAQCPLLGKYMSLFVPIGEFLPDTGAINAGFPRLEKNASHYIPFVFNSEASDRTFSVRISRLIDVMNSILADYRKRTDKSKLPLDAIATWMNGLYVRAQQFDASLCFHFAALYRVMANGMLNFSSQYRGDNAIQTLTDYCIVNDASLMLTRLYKPRDILATNIYGIRSGFVWQFLGNGVTPMMNRAGYNTSGAIMNTEVSEIIFPDPQTSYAGDMKLFDHFRSLTVPCGLVTTMFSDKILPDNPNKKRLISTIKVPTTVTSFKQMIKAIGEYLGIATEELGREYLNDDFLSKSSQRFINPVIRRLSMGIVVPFSSDIDPPVFEECIQMLTSVELRRLEVGLSMIVRSPLCKLKKGIRIGRCTVPFRTPDYLMPIPQSFKMIKYDEISFVPALNGVSVTSSLKYDDTIYPEVDSWPKLHIIIDSRAKTSAIYCKMLMEGVKIGNIIIDVLDQFFVPRIVPMIVSTQQLASDLLVEHVENIRVIDFTDAVLAFPNNIGTFDYSIVTQYQYIFPLVPVTDHISCSGLSNRFEGKPSNAKTVNAFEFDTGSLADYVPVFTTGANKLNSGIISMTNIVKSLSANMAYPSDIKFKSIQSKLFFPSMAGN